MPYLKNTQVLDCPTKEPGGYLTAPPALCTYGFSAYIIWTQLGGWAPCSSTSIEEPSETLLGMDGMGAVLLWDLQVIGDPETPTDHRPSKRHSGGLNCLYVDGHVKWHRRDQIWDDHPRWTPWVE
jgi:prepilin-type processing-associated H-X9-DG protein